MTGSDTVWKVTREGRAWAGQDAFTRFALAPEKLEMIGGKLLWSDDERLQLLALLLENVGADAAVRIGDPAVWRAAVNELP